MKSYLVMLFAFFALSGCSHSYEEATVKNYQHTFTSVGYAPIEAQSGESFDLKILNAIKASKLEAYREMAEQVYGVLVDANSNVDGAVLMNETIKAKVKGLVKGARVLRSYHEGDVYITELELNMQTLPFLSATGFEQQGVAVIKVEEAIYY